MTRPLLVVGIGLFAATAGADEAPDPGRIREAIARGLVIARKAAENYPLNRDCYSCHHQTLPMLAVVGAREAGLEVPTDLLPAQAEFTRASFAERQASLKKGEGIGGRAMTVGYGLLTLGLNGEAPDELTDDMVTFLLKTQDESGAWTTQARRPPMEESTITCTALAIHGLDHWAGPERRSEVAGPIRRGLAYIEGAPTRSNEDRAARLWALHRFGADQQKLSEARGSLQANQREDGGWAQAEGMGSDAYATGEAMAILSRTGTPADDPGFGRGVAFLLRTQEPDGSWFVETRSRPVQVFFDNGDPHGKSQFISVPATCWAVYALCGALPKP